MHILYHCFPLIALCIASSCQNSTGAANKSDPSKLELIYSVSAQTTTKAVTLDARQQKIVNELSWPVKIMFYKGLTSTTTKPKLRLKHLRRRAGYHASSVQGRRHIEDCDSKEGNEGGKTKGRLAMESEETQMKLKLFTLMDETARDCDLKVRRAELIKAHYKNNTAFEVGFLLGSISDKNRHMTDTANTLKRLYQEWKPIDHINAYEQIANQAIEISHLVESARHSIRRLEENKPPPAESSRAGKIHRNSL